MTQPKFDGTYDPADNKLRLRAVHRLDPELYARVRAAGFIWAPKQEMFVAPAWTPKREDLLLELCGEIGDEDTSLVDRAEERAERFEVYSDKRETEADRARAAVSAIADNIPLGQPILVGHHSERRARRDAERIEDGMRKAVNLWKTSRYWEQRAQGALRHAKYKELPAVRHRRMKGIEADKRKAEKQVAEANLLLKLWGRVEDPKLITRSGEPVTLRERALHIAGKAHITCCFPLATYPREPPASQYEGSVSLYSALEDGIITPEQARDIAIPVHQRTVDWRERWIAHYDHRLLYERAMLGEALGGQSFEEKWQDIQVGGKVLVRDTWVVVLRVNRKDGKVVSVSTNSPSWPRVAGIELLKGYEPPAEGMSEAAKDATRPLPLCNYPGEGFLYMTTAEWKARSKGGSSYYMTIVKGTNTIGAHRMRRGPLPGKVLQDLGVFLTDMKRVDPPPPGTGEELRAARQQLAEECERVLEPPRPPRPVDERKAEYDQLAATLKAGVQVVVADQLFPTPAPLAARLARLARLDAGQTVLEPSAGTGNLLRAIYDAAPCSTVSAIEIRSALVDHLRATFSPLFGTALTLDQADFLTWEPPTGVRFDRIVMNPPFGHGQDIQHILRARRWLKPGGLLVALCAAGARREDKLLPLVEEAGGTWEPLPAGSFSAQGTEVAVVLLTLPAAELQDDGDTGPTEETETNSRLASEAEDKETDMRTRITVASLQAVQDPGASPPPRIEGESEAGDAPDEGEPEEDAEEDPEEEEAEEDPEEDAEEDPEEEEAEEDLEEPAPDIVSGVAGDPAAPPAASSLQVAPVRVVLEAAELLRAVAGLCRVADPGSALKILHCVRLLAVPGEGLLLQATDLTRWGQIVLPTAVDRPAGACLPIVPVRDLLARLVKQGRHVAVAFEGVLTRITGEGTLTTEGAMTEFISLSPGDWPQVPTADPPLSAVDPQAFKAALRTVLPSASTEETRTHLCGVCLILLEGGTTRLVTTDGHRLACIDRPFALSGAPKGQRQILLPRKAAVGLDKLIDRRTERVQLGFEGDHFLAEVDGLRYLVHLPLAGSLFPPYEQVIPPEGERIVEVEREVWIRALQTVALMAKGALVILRMNDGVLQAAADNVEVGRTVAPVPARYAGGPFAIAFDVAYLREAACALSGHTVTLEMHGALDPVLMRTATERFVVMPQRIDTGDLALCPAARALPSFTQLARATAPASRPGRRPLAKGAAGKAKVLPSQGKVLAGPRGRPLPGVFVYRPAAAGPAVYGLRMPQTERQQTEGVVALLAPLPGQLGRVVMVALSTGRLEHVDVDLRGLPAMNAHQVTQAPRIKGALVASTDVPVVTLPVVTAPVVNVLPEESNPTLARARHDAAELEREMGQGQAGREAEIVSLEARRAKRDQHAQQAAARAPQPAAPVSFSWTFADGWEPPVNQVVIPAEAQRNDRCWADGCRWSCSGAKDRAEAHRKLRAHYFGHHVLEVPEAARAGLTCWAPGCPAEAGGGGSESWLRNHFTAFHVAHGDEEGGCPLHEGLVFKDAAHQLRHLERHTEIVVHLHGADHDHG